MNPDTLVKFLLTSLAPDDVMAKFDPNQLYAMLSGPVGGPAGRPFGLWGSFFGGFPVPELSLDEQMQLWLPGLLSGGGM